MRRVWPWWLRAGISVLAVVLLHWPFASYLWTLYPVMPAGLAPDGNPVYVGAPVGDLTARISDSTWRYAVGLGDAVPAAALAVVIYSLLTKRYGPSGVTESRCRQCGRVLRGLVEPRCPSCGQAI